MLTRKTKFLRDRQRAEPESKPGGCAESWGWNEVEMACIWEEKPWVSYLPA